MSQRRANKIDHFSASALVLPMPEKVIGSGHFKLYVAFHFLWPSQLTQRMNAGFAHKFGSFKWDATFSKQFKNLDL